MKTFLLMLLLLPAPVFAQTGRIAGLQGARHLVVDDQQHSSNQLVMGGETRMLYRKDGQLIAGRDTFDAKSATLRLKTLTRFSVDEDSTAFGSKYAVDYGLLAFRRSLNVGQWNSIVVPFSLTGSQLLDAFGVGTQVAMLQGVTDGDTPTVEFATVSLDTDDVVIEANNHYLIKPTRDPDIPEGGLTSVSYGSAKVAGPVYAIAGVTMKSGQSPKYQSVRSESNETRLRVRGSYAGLNVALSSNPRYVLGYEGRFSQLAESVWQKGFRSWIENASPDSSKPLRFFINGVGEDLSPEATGLYPLTLPTRHQNYYDLQGRRVLTPGKGLYIIDGKKVIIK